ncbi:AlpA family transcriptional regulator [Frigoribacterium sp. RIT-PI-h]|uniref:helix-turn-helix transcriptional regulator n=1 Tax=Frigoribacterium sp. RIT-PI-h TaxID=1690245 RepID=UPI0009E94C06|nr:helix-turn-helix domain-containing protein [Frigoribacterium sp. RIT-PI-h]
MTKLLTLEEVAEMLRRTPAQVRYMRSVNTGPRSAKMGGRIMFREQDVIDYINAAFEGQ